ncbi:MAG TPA: hypothetical protein VMU43_09755 [Candidatus Acidoferrum sp.]|nr:hypothetical protein [Candidatus Acidoferrum sp.]
MMTEMIKREKYNAVHCRSCGLAIAVPDAALLRARAGEAEDASAPQQRRSTMLNVRCHACEREYFYRPSDVVEMEGSPWAPPASTSTRLHRSRTRFARAASA